VNNIAGEHNYCLDWPEMGEEQTEDRQLVPFVAVAEQLVKAVVGQRFVVAVNAAGKIVKKLLDFQASIGFKSLKSVTEKRVEAVSV